MPSLDLLVSNEISSAPRPAAASSESSDVNSSFVHLRSDGDENDEDECASELESTSIEEAVLLCRRDHSRSQSPELVPVEAAAAAAVTGSEEKSEAVGRPLLVPLLLLEERSEGKAQSRTC